MGRPGLVLVAVAAERPSGAGLTFPAFSLPSLSRLHTSDPPALPSHPCDFHLGPDSGGPLLHVPLSSQARVPLFLTQEE